MPISIQADERDKFRRHAADALLARAGVIPWDGGNNFNGISLMDCVKESLEMAGQADAKKLGAIGMVGRALQTTDLTYVLGSVAQRAVLSGWENAPETWNQWCSVGSLPNFRPVTMARVGEFENLEPMVEGEPYRFGKIQERAETVTLGVYGKMFAMTRRAIIDDDLMQLANMNTAMGQSAARKVGDVAYAALTGNPTMGDGTALFATGHANYVGSGSGAPPGIATLSSGIKAMKLQKDEQDLQALNIRPEFFLAGASLEGSSEVFFRSDRFSDSDTPATDSSMASSRVNPYSGKFLTRIYEPRLDTANPDGWYLAARKGMTIGVFFLGGQMEPYVESRGGWEIDGLEIKCRIDCAACPLDWRGLYYNYGA